MLGWLFPRPPLDIVEKAWVETRMQWLAETLGVPRMLAVPVALPEPEWFGGDYDGTSENARQLMTRICQHLKVPARQIELQVAGRQCQVGSSGEFSEEVVPVSDQQLHDPIALTVVVAHQLVRPLLPLNDLAVQNGREVSWLIELACVYLGLGVYVANAVVTESTRQGHHACDSGSPLPHLPARMAGYALALFAHVRGESRPAWKSYLRLDALAAFHSGLKYLQRTGDTLFSSETAGQPPGAASTEGLLRQLTTGSRSARVAALWALRDRRHAATAVLAVASCLHDRLPAMREEAARTLAGYGPVATSAVPSLIELLHDTHYPTRAAAVLALGELETHSQEVLQHLVPLLSDPERDVIFRAAEAVSKFGEGGEDAIPALLSALRSALIRCDHGLIQALTHALYALDPDPTDRVMEFFEDDRELREQTVHIIIDALGIHGKDGRIA